MVRRQRLAGTMMNWIKKKWVDRTLGKGGSEWTISAAFEGIHRQGLDDEHVRQHRSANRSKLFSLP